MLMFPDICMHCIQCYSQKKKNIIKQVISEEDNKNPLTDDEMVLVLMRKNAKIARRTITKYRKELNLIKCQPLSLGVLSLLLLYLT